MALTLADIAVALRLSADGTDLPQAQQTILTRLQGVAEAYITLLAPDAPEAVQDEATIRLVAYLYDVPAAGRRDAYANGFVNSGAGSLLSQWAPQAACGTDAVLVARGGGVGPSPTPSTITFSYGVAASRTGPILNARTLSLSPGIGSTFDITTPGYPAVAGQFTRWTWSTDFASRFWKPGLYRPTSREARPTMLRRSRRPAPGGTRLGLQKT